VTPEVVVPAAFVWLACLVRIGVAALGRAPLDRDLALAAALLVALSVLLWREVAASLRPPPED